MSKTLWDIRKELIVERTELLVDDSPIAADHFREFTRDELPVFRFIINHIKQIKKVVNTVVVSNYKSITYTDFYYSEKKDLFIAHGITDEGDKFQVEFGIEKNKLKKARAFGDYKKRYQKMIHMTTKLSKYI